MPEAPKTAGLPLFTNLTRQWELDAAKPVLHHASVFYIKPGLLYESEKPYFFNVPTDPEWEPQVKQSNVEYTRKTVAVADIRGHEACFTLDAHGFQLGKLASSLSYADFAVTDTVVTRYYEEVEAFLKAATGAIEVLPFDFQVRRRDPALPPNSRGAPGKAQPFAVVHGDQTANAAYRRLKYFHPAMAKKHARSRFQIVNVWRPLRGPVRDSPLAVCDYRSVNKEDCVPTDVIFPDYLGETYHFWPNPNHRFYFIDEQQADEAWMIKCFDSATAENADIAQFTPHASFPYRKEGTENMKVEPRESVEVRTFVFF